MERGQYLIDAKAPEERFKIKQFLAEGTHFQVALVLDGAHQNRFVCAKVFANQDTDEDNNNALTGDDIFGQEETLLKRSLTGLPRFVGRIEVVDQSSQRHHEESVLLYEYQTGDTLYDWVQNYHHEGIKPESALLIFRQIVSIISRVHSAGYVFRNLDPRHIIIQSPTKIALVGTNNAVSVGTAVPDFRQCDSPLYIAPEIRQIDSINENHFVADIFGLGAVLSYMLTAIEPQERAETPLTEEAFHRLSNVELPGLSLLVARCLQAQASKRFESVSQLLSFCSVESLPTTTTPGFGMLYLPGPWSGVDDPNNRALRSQISSGPLLSVDKKEGISTSTNDVVSDGLRTLPIGMIVGLCLILALIIATIFRVMTQ